MGLIIILAFLSLSASEAKITTFISLDNGGLCPFFVMEFHIIKLLLSMEGFGNGHRMGICDYEHARYCIW